MNVGTELFFELYRRIKNPIMAHLDVDAVRHGDVRLAQLGNEGVFTFHADNDAVIIQPVGGQPERFTDAELAASRASDLINVVRWRAQYIPRAFQ